MRAFMSRPSGPPVLQGRSPMAQSRRPQRAAAPLTARHALLHGGTARHAFTDLHSVSSITNRSTANIAAGSSSRREGSAITAVAPRRPPAVPGIVEPAAEGKADPSRGQQSRAVADDVEATAPSSGMAELKALLDAGARVARVHADIVARNGLLESRVAELEAEVTMLRNLNATLTTTQGSAAAGVPTKEAAAAVAAAAKGEVAVAPAPASGTPKGKEAAEAAVAAAAVEGMTAAAVAGALKNKAAAAGAKTEDMVTAAGAARTGPMSEDVAPVAPAAGALQDQLAAMPASAAQPPSYSLDFLDSLHAKMAAEAEAALLRLSVDAEGQKEGQGQKPPGGARAGGTTRRRGVPKSPPGIHGVSGMRVCVTGKLQGPDGKGLKRADMQALLVAAGALFQNDVNAATELLVVGWAAGSKKSRAAAKGIRVVEEEDFWREFYHRD